MSSARIETKAKSASEGLALSCFELERRVAELEAALASERSGHAATRAELEAARATARKIEAAYARLETQHTELADTYALVAQERDQLLKRFLGRKSEKDRNGSGQLSLPLDQAEDGTKDDAATAATAEPETKAQETATTGAASTSNDASASLEKKPRRKGGRKRPSERNPNLEQIREVIPVPEHLLVCACGKHKVQIGEETSEKLTRRPSSYYILVTVRPVLACEDGCEQAVVCPPAPASRIEHGLADEGVHAYVLASKFGDHLPLNRIAGIMARESAIVSTSTLGDWVARDAYDLSPVYRAMIEQVLAGPIVRTDDTSIRVLDKNAEDGVRSGRIWAYLGVKPGDLFFTYSATKENADEEGCHAVLADFFGTVQADASNGYDALFRGGTRCEAGCWCHCRRKFFDAQNAFPKQAEHALGFIKALYMIEKQAKIAELNADARRALRQEESRPIVDAFFEWVKRESARAVPKTLLATALGYAKNQEQALRAFLDDGRLEPDNNDTERALRQVAVGRRAWLFAGNADAARNTSVVVTLVYACKELGIDPVVYLTDVLTRLPTHPASRVSELTPREWLEARQTAAATIVTS